MYQTNLTHQHPAVENDTQGLKTLHTSLHSIKIPIWSCKEARGILIPLNYFRIHNIDIYLIT